MLWMPCNFINDWKSIYCINILKYLKKNIFCTQNKQLTCFVGKSLSTFYLLITSIYDHKKSQKRKKTKRNEKKRKSHFVISIYWFTNKDPVDHKKYRLVFCSILHIPIPVYLSCFQCKKIYIKNTVLMRFLISSFGAHRLTAY